MNLQVLNGSLLGDMYIQKYKERKNSYAISFQQSEFQYAKWKAEMCGVDYTLTKYKRYDKRTDRYYYGYNVYLKVDKKYKEKLYRSFYKPEKEVSYEILNELSPLAICVWYLDDGSMYYNGNNCHLYLGVDGFNDESKNNIINYFRDKHDINFKKTRVSIRLTSRKEVEKFMNLVGKYIPKCMKRKTFKYQFEKYDKTLSDEQRKYRNNKYKR